MSGRWGRVQEHQIGCETDGCTSRAVFHLTWTQFRRSQREQNLCEEHARFVLKNHDFGEPIGRGENAVSDGARCFDIELIVIAETYNEQVVYLREIGGKRYFPLLIGIFEATSLDRALKGFKAPRPLTHDAMLSAIQALDGELQDILIVDRKEHTFFTNLRIRRYHQTVLVDTRPSDAFVLAVLDNKPIFVSDQVLPKLGL